MDRAAESTESFSTREDVAADSEFATDATPEPRDDTSVDNAEDIAESAATREDVAADSEFATDATPETRDDTLVESAEDIALSAATSVNLEVVIEFSSARMSDVLPAVTTATAELTLSIILCITDPVDRSADISARVSSVDGAPPTTPMTAAATALDRLTPSALIATDSVESTTLREDTAV